MSFPTGLRDALGCSRFAELDGARLVTVWKIEDGNGKTGTSKGIKTEEEREGGGEEIRH